VIKEDNRLARMYKQVQDSLHAKTRSLFLFLLDRILYLLKAKL